MKNQTWRKAGRWFRNLSLNGKIIMMICFVGFLPLGIVLTVSLSAMDRQSEERQIYAMNQGYEQVNQAVADRLARVQNISTLLAVDETVHLSLKWSEEELAEQLVRFGSLNSYAYGMEMTSEVGNILFYIDGSAPVADSQSTRYRPLEDAWQADWYPALVENSGRPTWVKFGESIYDREYSYVAVTRMLWDSEDYSVSTGILAVYIDRKSLEDMLFSSMEEQTIYIETGNGLWLAGNREEEASLRLPAEYRSLADSGFHRMWLEGSEYMVRSTFLDRFDLYLVSLVPVRAMEQAVHDVNFRVRLICVLLCVFVLLAFIPMTKFVTSRIQLLKNQMMQIEDGVICKIDVENNYQDEIGQLITHYNDMVDKLQELMQEQYTLGQEKIGAELKALQSQINPHFLYNTLDMINWMAQKNETDNICSVVQAMSRFYRLTLSKGDDIVTISDEIKMCDAYMEIQRRRYKGRILYRVELEEDVMDCLIPKITLQPFLENAIIHGINEKEDARGVVMLDGWMEDERITLSVTDDGVGIREESRKQSPAGSHYGMENIADRLRLFFGEEIPIQVESSPGVGTCIIINIPIRRKEMLR